MAEICSHGGPLLPADPFDLAPALFDAVQTSGKFLEEVQKFSAGAGCMLVASLPPSPKNGCMDVWAALGGAKRLALCVEGGGFVEVDFAWGGVSLLGAQKGAVWRSRFEE